MSQRKVILSMQVTLDGYVSAKNDQMDWLRSSNEEWKSLLTELKDSDTYLLGRKMYPGYSQYWQSVLRNPDGQGFELEYAKLADKTQHIVFSKGDFKPDWKNTRVSHDIKSEINNLRSQPGKNIIAWGGANFAANLINLGVLDELRLVVNPSILGDGKSLFETVDQHRQLELMESVPLEPGLVLLRYKI